VREKAVESINAVLRGMQTTRPEVLDMVKRLCAGEWFTSRVSACGLFGAVYAHLTSSEVRSQLRSQYEVLAKDEAPMVRRAAAANLGRFAQSMEGEFVVSALLPIFEGCAMDEQDSVRLLAIDQCTLLAKVLSSAGRMDDCASRVIPVVRTVVEDRSWRVRFSVAKGLSGVAEAVGGAITLKELVGPLTALLQDPETEVRAAMLKESPKLVNAMGPEAFVAQVMPYVQALTQDANLGVRVALSGACMQLCPSLGQEPTVRVLQPMLAHFLRDESSEVRLHVLEQLDVLAAWLPSMAEQLLPLIVELREDNVWRIRKAVMIRLPLLAERMGVQYFEEHLLETYLAAYQDSVCEVRAGASSGLQRLCQVCGSDWVSSHLLPSIRGMFEGSSFYLIRITVLESLKDLMCETAGAPKDGMAESLISEALDIVLLGSRDSVPNVRFTAVRALQDFAPRVDQTTLEGQIRPCLTGLSDSDPDDDVKYFANHALEIIKSMA
jgi:serine/threonine-protein phosphatase 2A regulatory subunit A